MEDVKRGATLDDALQLKGHTYHCTGAAFSADSKVLVTCSTDRTVRVWDVGRCFEQRRATKSNKIRDTAVAAALLTGPTAGVQCVTFDKSGELICAGDDDGVVWVWKREKRRQPEVAPESREYWALVNPLHGHSGQIFSIDPLPDGRILTAGDDATLRIWNPILEDIPRLRGHGTAVTAVAVTPDGKYAISGDGQYAMMVWDLEKRERVADVESPPAMAVSDLACWRVNATQFVGAAYRNIHDTSHGRLVVWRLNDHGTPSFLFEYFGAAGDATTSPAFLSIAVSGDGRRLAAGDGAGFVHILELGEDGRGFPRAAPRRVHDNAVTAAVFLDAAGRWLVTTAGALDPDQQAPDYSVRVIDAEAGGPVDGFAAATHTNSVRGLAVRFDDAVRHEDARRAVEMATSADDGSICLWKVEWASDVPRLILRETLKGHRGAVFGVAFHPRESRLASVGRDRTLRIWDTERPSEIVALRGAKGPLYDLAFDSNGRRLLTACGGMTGVDNAVLLWGSDVPADVETP